MQDNTNICVWYQCFSSFNLLCWSLLVLYLTFHSSKFMQTKKNMQLLCQDYLCQLKLPGPNKRRGLPPTPMSTPSLNFSFFRPFSDTIQWALEGYVSPPQRINSTGIGNVNQIVSRVVKHDVKWIPAQLQEVRPTPTSLHRTLTQCVSDRSLTVSPPHSPHRFLYTQKLVP